MSKDDQNISEKTDTTVEDEVDLLIPPRAPRLCPTKPNPNRLI